MSNKPIAQVAISTIKTATKQDIYPKTTEKAVVVTTTDPDNGSSTTLDKVIVICKDKEYSQSLPNGLGRHVLKKNIVDGNNILTSDMLSTPNTEYYIQYDFDLDEANITLPANSTLYFIGGSLKNGTLTGNNTRIVAKKGVMIFDNITIKGTWDVAEAYSSWFKMYKGGYKIASVTEYGATLYKGTDNNYYDFEDLRLVGSYYYVTSTLEGGEVVSGSIKATAATYATFRIEGDNTDYVAAPTGVPGTFNATSYAQKDDTEALQSLFDIRAKKTVIEDGVYMIDALKNNYDTNRWTGLFYDKQKNAELIIDGWLKVIPNDKSKTYYALDITDCDCIKISGKGGIQGELLEHTGANPNPPSFYSEWGMNIAVATTRNLLMENITVEYAWGDLIYSHWRNYSRGGNANANSSQNKHTYRNLTLNYGGRTGYGCELADNVVFDGCYFYGSGRVRGKETKSAIDIEPFNTDDTPQRYVKNYEFKNNYFKNSARGLRLERCVNCSIHNNEFNYGSSGIEVIWHKDVNYDITSPNDRGWLKSRMSIYNNIIKRCTVGISLTQSEPAAAPSYRKLLENVQIFGNTLISCDIVINGISRMKDCKIYDNITYGCGKWYFNVLEDCDIHGNINHGCKMPVYVAGWGNGPILEIGNIGNSSNSKFHHNYFSLDYGKPILGLGENGKEELYHGLPVGYRCEFAKGVNLTVPTKIHFYENKVTDDFWVLYSSNYTYQGNNDFVGGMNCLRDEDSGVFIKGDTFRSSTYGDEGTVIHGGIISTPQLESARNFDDYTDVEQGIYMDVAYGEIIKVGDNYKICSKGGQCGETYSGGTAGFISSDGTVYAPNSTSAAQIKIAFTTRGVCTSETRPDSFLYAGRRMWETDTNKEIVYDGNDWVYNDIYTEE